MPEAQKPVAAPWNGAVPAAGVASAIRIPVPGTDRLAIQLDPINFRGRSTSTLFIQDPTGKRMLRLDFGRNVRTRTVDYHWNQKGTFEDFRIANHAPAGARGAALYRAAKGFRYAGRTLLVVGLVVDTVSIVQSNQPLRRATQAATAWAAAWAGAEAAGALGAGIGTAVEPGGGTAALGLVFAVGGGVAGYWGGEKAGADVYDWGAAAFLPLPAAR